MTCPPASAVVHRESRVAGQPTPVSSFSLFVILRSVIRLPALAASCHPSAQASTHTQPFTSAVSQRQPAQPLARASTNVQLFARIGTVVCPFPNVSHAHESLPLAFLPSIRISPVCIPPQPSHPPPCVAVYTCMSPSHSPQHSHPSSSVRAPPQCVPVSQSSACGNTGMFSFLFHGLY